MILVDSRIGSKHMVDKLSPAQLETLEFGDCCFTGGNRLIGIELKRINDCVSSLLSGRFADGQLPGMLQMYDVSYLIVEGYYRCDPQSGLVQGWRGGRWSDLVSGRQRLTWSALDNWLTSMETLGGLRVRRTTTEAETIKTIQALYNWWQRDDHKSLHVFNTASDAAAVERPGLLRRMAAQLPMIGWQRSADVAKRFTSVRNMALAELDDWTDIDGIGPGIAAKVWSAINGER